MGAHFSLLHPAVLPRNCPGRRSQDEAEAARTLVPDGDCLAVPPLSPSPVLVGVHSCQEKCDVRSSLGHHPCQVLSLANGDPLGAGGKANGGLPLWPGVGVRPPKPEGRWGGALPAPTHRLGLLRGSSSKLSVKMAPAQGVGRPNPHLQLLRFHSQGGPGPSPPCPVPRPRAYTESPRSRALYCRMTHLPPTPDCQTHGTHRMHSHHMRPPSSPTPAGHRAGVGETLPLGPPPWGCHSSPSLFGRVG